MQSVIPVFIASPNDVSNERKYTVEAVNNVSSKVASIYGIVLTPIRWEEFAPISSREATNPQFNILKRIKSHSIFVGILHKRYGTKIPEMGDISGTESEFNHALEHRENIQILTYFKNVKNTHKLNNDEVEQLAGVNKLKSKLSRERKILHATYTSPAEFRRRIALDLFEAVLNMIKAPIDVRLNHYEKFFKFSSNHLEKRPPLLIVYPPISDPMFGHRNLQTDWKKYLLPTAVLEDTKAIQSLEKTLNLIDQNYLTVMDCSLELKLSPPGDRLWICISRNQDAKNSLKNLGDRPYFSFVDPDGESQNQRQLIWKKNEGEEIRLVSPLAKYLEVSKRPSSKQKWEPSYGLIYARDYAVIARFCVTPNEIYEPSNRLFYYYLGGLRALGTWGSGHFIEQCSAKLAEVIDEIESTRSDTSQNSDIQILLEITYINYRIVEVSVVSDQPPDFFEKRNSLEYIEQEYIKANTHM